MAGIARPRRPERASGRGVLPGRPRLQPSTDEPGGVYGIVKRPGVWIHFQIRRGEIPVRQRQVFERDVYVYVDDLDALYADLKRRGAVIQQSPQVAPMAFARSKSLTRTATG
jgi:hypothetical protein